MNGLINSAHQGSLHLKASKSILATIKKIWKDNKNETQPNKDILIENDQDFFNPLKNLVLEELCKYISIKV